MTTIMSWESSGGKRRTCSATCHNAKGSRCRCVCGGRYHGAAHRPGGVEQAVRDTWEEAIQEAEARAKAEGLKLDTTGIRKIIGLEPDKHDNHDNHDNEKPKYCPNCAAPLQDKYNAVAIESTEQNLTGYDCYCSKCKWSGDIWPDDEADKEELAK